MEGSVSGRKLRIAQEIIVRNLRLFCIYFN